jgi:hypothetical protein
MGTLRKQPRLVAARITIPVGGLIATTLIAAAAAVNFRPPPTG